MYTIHVCVFVSVRQALYVEQWAAASANSSSSRMDRSVEADIVASWRKFNPRMNVGVNDSKETTKWVFRSCVY